MARVAVPDYVRFGVPSTLRLFRALTGAIRKVHDFLTVGAPAPLQAAAAVGLPDDPRPVRGQGERGVVERTGVEPRHGAGCGIDPRQRAPLPQPQAAVAGLQQRQARSWQVVTRS